MEKYNVYIKKFKVAVGICAAALVIIIVLISKMVPGIQNIIELQNEYKQQSLTLEDAERKLEDLKASAEKRKAEEQNITKAFFKPINSGLDTEASISEEFGEILQLIRENKIKARSINYEYDPQDDNFVKNVSAKYQVCRISAEMIASYTDFENFMRELYKHEHFLEISKIEIIPYEKNKRILLISLQIKLYAEKA